jgi:hypothetical protein
MRKILTLIAIACFAHSLNAQTLLRTELPDTGDVQIYRKADTTGVTEGPGGTGQAWNFSSLVQTPVVGTNRYVTPATHPQGSFYATANLCFSPLNDAWAFYQASADSLYIIGEKSLTNTRLTYTDGGAWYRFPQSFMVANTDSVEGTYPDGFISTVTRNGFIMSTYDGEGSLITPFATYPSVKRVELIGIYRDSSWTGAAESDIFIKRYEWYAAGNRMPVLIIHNQMIILNGGNPQILKDVYWGDSTAVGIDNAFEGRFDLSPNPSNGHARLQYSLDADQHVGIEVFNMLGKRVKTLCEELQSPGHHQVDFDMVGAAKGLYYVRLNTAQGTATRKLVIE